MSESAAGPPPGQPGADPQLTPEQQEALRQMEEEMRRVRVEDLVTQSAVSILNLAYRRIAKEDERDLDQARIGIDAVAALADQLQPEPRREVLNALSQVRMEFAKHAAAPDADAGDAGGGSDDVAPGGDASGAGAGESSASGRRQPPPGLWVPGAD